MRLARCALRLLSGGVLLAIVSISTSAFGYGEPDVDGLPNSFERQLHVFTNQVRQAPHEWPGWDTSLATDDARPPVAHQPGLGAAARFHADDMKANGCFAHESCDGTTFEVRVARYFDGLAGENIYNAFGDQSARSAITGWMTSDGHRTNMLMMEWTHLGAGHAYDAGLVWYVQDFGFVPRATIPMIPAAAWEPRSTDTMLHANFWDPSGRAPAQVTAHVDNREVALAHAAGPPGNETYSAGVDTPEECAELYFTARDADGDEARYPSEGALLFGPDCTSEFVGTPSPRPDRLIVDADRRGGCAAAERSDGGLSPLLLMALLLVVRKR
jgi:uncharacterized protein YkwD